LGPKKGRSFWKERALLGKGFHGRTRWRIRKNLNSVYLERLRKLKEQGTLIEGQPNRKEEGKKRRKDWLTSVKKDFSKKGSYMAFGKFEGRTFKGLPNFLGGEFFLSQFPT